MLSLLRELDAVLIVGFPYTISAFVIFLELVWQLNLSASRVDVLEDVKGTH
jgi:hypothetical protein